MLDLLIKGGMIVDGSGNPGYYGTIGVSKDSITIFRGDVASLESRRIIDATGKIISPGFIDVHAHSALMILDDPMHMPKVHQGITTELIGIDGNSYAPFKSQKDLDDFIDLNSGLEGRPELTKTWSSVSEYLDIYDRKVSVNIAYIVGNSPIRIGGVGWDNRKPTNAELEHMKALLRESIQEGAFGISTGLDYPPGSYADTKELVDLSKEVARLGGFYHTHVRYSLGDRYLDPFQEALEIGWRSGIPIHLTHVMRRVTYPGGGNRILEMIENARDKGMDVTFDCFPYPVGGTRLLIIFPQWTQDGGPDKLRKVLASEESRKLLRKEVGPRGLTWDEMWLTYFNKPQNKRFEGKSIAAVSDMLGKHPVDAICDLLLDENLQISYTGSTADGGTIHDFVTHPLQMTGSDALLLGDFPPPMAYGTFPIILSQIVRDEKRMKLEEAIRKMTAFPAQRLGIRDRGLLHDGMKADITIFDAETIKAHSTRHNPKQLSTGVEYVIVNGQIVIDQGHHTGILPGRALRYR